MFLQVCVILSTGGVPDQVQPPGTRYPPDQVHCPWTRYTPRDQVLPWTRYTPPGPGTPPRPGTPSWTRYTPGTRYTPPRSTRGRYASYWNAILFCRYVVVVSLFPNSNRKSNRAAQWAKELHWLHWCAILFAWCPHLHIWMLTETLWPWKKVVE